MDSSSLARPPSDDSSDISESTALQAILATLAFISASLSLVVVVSYIALIIEKSANEKPWRTRTLNLFFTIVTFILSVFLIMEPLAGEDFFKENDGLCTFQGVMILYLVSAMVWFWFFVTCRLLFVVYFKKSFDTRNRYFVIAALIFAAVSSIPPAAADAISFEYIWCFIDSSEYLWLYGFFYGTLGAVCIAGSILGLWLVIYILSVYYAFLKEKNKEGSFTNLIKSLRDAQAKHRHHRYRRRSKLYGGGEEEGEGEGEGESEAGESYEYRVEEDDSEEDEENSMHEGVEEDKPLDPHRGEGQLATVYLIFRQIVFSFSFVILFAVTFFNQLYITVTSSPSLWGWILHAIVMCCFGISTFFVFGLTRENILLWRRARRTAYEKLSWLISSTENEDGEVEPAPLASLYYCPGVCFTWCCSYMCRRKEFVALED